MEHIKTIVINTLLIPFVLLLIVSIMYMLGRIIPDKIIKKLDVIIFLILFVVGILAISFFIGNEIMHGLGYSYIKYF